MLKILFADDEILEITVLAKMITKEVKDAVVVGEALNGRKAIEMAREHKPDIIFMDIKMPGIDGIQAVKEIRKFQPMAKFIMVSAFNTFEYAKEVMQEGVKEYILKPSSKEDILSAFKRVSAEIMAERKQKEEQQTLRENLDRAVSIAQKEWVSSLLINQVQDITFDEWGQLLGAEIISGYIMLFSYQAAGKYEPDQNDKQNWYSWLKEALKTVVKHQEIMVGPLNDNQAPVLFLCKKTDKKVHFKSDASGMITRVQALFQEQLFQGSLKIGIGFPYKHAHELNKSYHEAAFALQKLLKMSDQSFLFGDMQGGEELPTVTQSGIFEIEKKLLDAVRKGDSKQVLFIFDSFITTRAANANIKASVVKKSFEELFVLLSRMLHDLGISYERAPVMEEEENINGMLEKGKKHLLSMIQQVQIWRNNHAKGMLYKAKEYIEKHYADSLTLESVAEYVELSPYYFSKLFKDRYGKTFIDYLTEVRIGRAKAEMEDKTKSLKEICFSIGYNDPNYFSRVFKKMTGLSPTDFRKAN